MRGIPDKPYFKIGEVCQYTDTQPYVLRFWESEFPQLAPEKSRSGQRMYTRRDIEMVLKIKKLLYEEEFTIAGARKQLEMEAAAETGSALESLLPNGAHSRPEISSPPDAEDDEGSGPWTARQEASLLPVATPAPGTDAPVESLPSGPSEDASRPVLLRRILDLEERQARLEQEIESTRAAGNRRRERSLGVASRLEKLLADLDGGEGAP